jgi:FkbM family methyltransferase
MALISYAQNAEDVLLWRALGHIEHGFYIDVGANDPVEHSVTKIFYDAGWHGINIEPMQSYHVQFQQARPRDINLAVACGATEGSITLFDTPAVNGWASTDAATAASHRADGVAIVEQQVPLRTLSAICAEHAPEHIHFLKIDVEGFEAEVLRGIDLQRWRPWVLVIEATLPNSRITNHEHWEALVTPHGYQFAWFDGLNRYYVAAEHAQLLAALSVQPNVFDDYIHHHLDQALQRINTLQGQSTNSSATTPPATASAHQVSALRAELAQARAMALRASDTPALHRELAHTAGLLAETRVQLSRAQQQIRAVRYSLRDADRQRALAQQETGRAEQLQLKATTLAQQRADRVTALETSWSWRITAPLRAANYYRHPHRLLALLRTTARRHLLQLAQQPTLRRAGFGLLRRYPALGDRLLGWYATLRGSAPGHAPAGVPQAVAQLPQPVRRVLADLEHSHSRPDN